MAKKILIIDDEKDIADITAFKFKQKGFDVILAHGGKDGLKMAQSEGPDLILLDEKMPEMDGFQVCAALKADGELKAIPVIMFTARTSDEIDQDSCQEAGFDDVITKLADFEDLLAKVNTLLNET